MTTKVNMKLKQAVLAGGLVALSLGSMSAQAMRLSEPGEAQLVPFVIWDSTPICLPTVPGGPAPSPLCADKGVPTATPSILGINTAVKITVPQTVGNDVIPNFFTATHTTPTNDPNCVPPGDVNNPGCEQPADPDLVPSNLVHWFFLDQNSIHRLNGTIPVTPDDVAVIDWGATVRKNGKQGELDGRPGYLVLTTEAGARGNDADFSFFTEGWMFIGVDSFFAVDPGTTGGVIGLVDALVPTLAMNDGADDRAQLGTEVPSLANSVIEIGVNLSVKASPLVTGIRTNWSDGNGLTDIKVVDLTLGNRNIPIGGPSLLNFLQVPTLMVIWNDRNATQWDGVGVQVYNDSEEFCSDSISLPQELNLVWVQTDVTAGNNPAFPPWPVPRFIERFGINQVFCVPPFSGGAGDNLLALERSLEGGFIKLFLPEPVDTGIFAPESAAAMFSIPLQLFVTFEPVAGGPPGAVVLTDASLVPFETALGHDRGMFNIAP